MAQVRVEVLGRLTLQVADVDRTPTGALEAGVLARLAIARGSPVSAEALVDEVWPHATWEGGRRSLQVHVSNLRQRLRPHEHLLRHDRSAYRLAGPGLSVDLDDLDELAAQGRDARAAGDLTTASAALRSALLLVRGELAPPLSGARVEAERAHYEELVAALVDERLQLDVELEQPWAVVDLEAGVREAPLRERRWALLMLALYRADRQVEALAAYRRAREVLAEAAGVDPGLALRRLEAAILSQDDAEGLLRTFDDRTVVRPEGVPCLLYLDEHGRPRRRELPRSGEVVLGRLETADLRMDGDPVVSRRHAVVRRIADGWEVEDLGSTNGTTVNGVPATGPVPLRPGDIVGCGDTRLLVSTPRTHPSAGSARVTERRSTGDDGRRTT